MFIVSWFFVQLFQISFNMHGKIGYNLRIILDVFKCKSNVEGDDNL
jgi:hypothetical protein